MDSFIAVGIAAILPYIPHAVKAYAVIASGKKYDLKAPRDSVAAASDLTPQGKFISRSHACHLNGLESWPQFAISVLMAHVAGVDRSSQNYASAVYLISRLFYTYFYLSGTTGKVALLRTSSWVVGAVSCAYLMVQAAKARGGTSS